MHKVQKGYDMRKMDNIHGDHEESSEAQLAYKIVRFSKIREKHEKELERCDEELRGLEALAVEVYAEHEAACRKELEKRRNR